MSIQSEIDRIKGNVTVALAKIAEKGVTVPDGANSDNLEALIEAISSGTKIEIKTIVPSEDVKNGATLTVEHGLGEVPRMVLVFTGDSVDASSYGIKFGLFFMESKFEYINYNSQNSFYGAYAFRKSSDFSAGCSKITKNSSTLKSLISGRSVPISDATESYIVLCGVGDNTIANLKAGKTYKLIMVGW